MFTFKIKDRTIEQLVSNYKKNIVSNIDAALDDIRMYWQSEMRLQQGTMGRGTWQPLSEEYGRRKQREFPGRPILTRTGAMMNAYTSGILINPMTYTVSIPFPNDPDLRTRARAHQGVTGRPKNMPARPFVQKPFEDLAVKRFRDAIAKSLRP